MELDGGMVQGHELQDLLFNNTCLKFNPDGLDHKIIESDPIHVPFQDFK